MIQVISKIFVMEEKVEDFVDLFKLMIKPTLEERGCIQYEMYQDQDDYKVLIVIEQWEDKECFDNHLSSEHFKEIGPKMTKLMSKDTELNISYKIA